MAEQLPGAHVLPVDDRSLRRYSIAALEPALPKPVAATHAALRVDQLDDDDDDAGEDDAEDAQKLDGHEEVVEPGRGLGADAVADVHEHHDQHRQELVQDARGLVRHARGREDALDEDDAQDGHGAGHDDEDPRPRGQESENVTVDVLQVRLHATCVEKSAFMTTTRHRSNKHTLARNRRAQLRHGARARPREAAANHPDDQRPARGRHVGVDGARRREDAAADDDADDDGEGVQAAEVLLEGAGRMLARHGAGDGLCCGHGRVDAIRHVGRAGIGREVSEERPGRVILDGCRCHRGLVRVIVLGLGC